MGNKLSKEERAAYSKFIHGKHQDLADRAGVTLNRVRNFFHGHNNDQMVMEQLLQMILELKETTVVEELRAQLQGID
jgi:hypothetical protein